MASDVNDQLRTKREGLSSEVNIAIAKKLTRVELKEIKKALIYFGWAYESCQRSGYPRSPGPLPRKGYLYIAVGTDQLKRIAKHLVSCIGYIEKAKKHSVKIEVIAKSLVGRDVQNINSKKLSAYGKKINEKIDSISKYIKETLQLDLTQLKSKGYDTPVNLEFSKDFDIRMMEIQQLLLNLYNNVHSLLELES
tara:strand:- start:136 stop:717 length:582 start_codon:yes stop_codon:yes gene_type:complete